MDYDIIICFETHVELKTKTKLFCDCPVNPDAPPNTQVCPVCTGQPGALPVLNKKAVEFAVRAGLALNCSINNKSRFARKNYFYPDLPKGYQISQYERPFCENGFMEIPGDDGQPYAVGIKRIHLEEDAGKLVHSSESFDSSDYSLVDYNRSSVPLLEIVGDHETNPLRSIKEARVYLEKLHQILKYIDISDCRLERGEFRCDVNVSIRPRGTMEFGNRAEVKNMASFRFIAQALEYEIGRQKEIVESGGRVDQETRLFDEVQRITLPMRSKEDAPDYRYFPDPDLVEGELNDAFIENVRRKIPILPDQKVDTLVNEYGIPKSDALILSKDRQISDYFGACAPLCQDKRKLGNWIVKELFRLLNDTGVSIEKCPIAPEDFSLLINHITKGDITEGIGRTVLDEMFATGHSPDSIIQEKGLQVIQDDDLLDEILQKVLDENPEPLAKIRAGETKSIDYLIGQVMRLTKGKADPKRVRDLIQEKLLA